MKIVGLFSKNWDAEEEDSVTEDDLSEIIDTVEDEGVIDEDTSDLLQSALDFPDICAYEIITPRVDMIAIDIDDEESEIRETIESSPYSRIPVYEDSIDNIIGVIHLNQFLKTMSEGGTPDIRACPFALYIKPPSCRRSCVKCVKRRSTWPSLPTNTAEQWV